MRTAWPNLANSRAQWWAPEQASMPIRHGGRFAMSSSSFAGYLGPHQCGFASFVYAIHGKDVLCKVDSNGYDSYDFPFH